MTKLRGAVIGTGYFSQFQLEAWTRIPEVDIVAVVDLDSEKAQAAAKQHQIPQTYTSYTTLFENETLDFVDIVTPPTTHLEICQAAIERNLHVICQKPLAPTYQESVQIIEMMQAADVRFMVHENWRWQPWYREIKQLIEADVLGEIFCVNFRMRTGDGWGDDAYLARQPFFREYERLLMFETGVHFIDTFRYLLGEIDTIYARLRQLNPVIKGEDSGQIIFGFESGATAIFDSNRYNEIDTENQRFTFGEMRIDGSEGHLLLDPEGQLYLKALGGSTQQHHFTYEKIGFAGDCVHALQRHFVDVMVNGGDFESNGPDYLKTIQLVEACYTSAQDNTVINMKGWEP